MGIDVSASLSAQRQAAGLSQDQLAAKLFVSRQAVSKWERGEAMPDTANLVAMADLVPCQCRRIAWTKRRRRAHTTAYQ